METEWRLKEVTWRLSFRSTFIKIISIIKRLIKKSVFFYWENKELFNYKNVEITFNLKTKELMCMSIRQK